MSLGMSLATRCTVSRQETAKVRDDVLPGKRAQFDEAVTALCRLSNSEVSEFAIKSNNQVDHTGQTLVCTAIDRLVETVN